MSKPYCGPKENTALHGGGADLPTFEETNARPVKEGGKEGALPARDDAARCALEGKSGTMLP